MAPKRAGRPALTAALWTRGGHLPTTIAGPGRHVYRGIHPQQRRCSACALGRLGAVSVILTFLGQPNETIAVVVCIMSCLAQAISLGSGALLDSKGPRVTAVTASSLVAVGVVLTGIAQRTGTPSPTVDGAYGPCWRRCRSRAFGLAGQMDGRGRRSSKRSIPRRVCGHGRWLVHRVHGGTSGRCSNSRVDPVRRSHLAPHARIHGLSV